MVEGLTKIRRNLEHRTKVHVGMSPNNILASSGASILLEEAFEMRQKMKTLNDGLSMQLRTLSGNRFVKRLLDYVNDYYGFWKWILEKQQKIKNIKKIPLTWKYRKFKREKIKAVLGKIEMYMESVDRQGLGRRITL